jgi:hypothetical protein
MRLSRLLPLAVMTLASGVAAASPAHDAEQHFRAIASGDVAKIMQQYAGNTTFEWIGGPLNGTYNSKSAIKTVWTKFSKAVAPKQFKISYLFPAANGDGQTVTANVEFEGHKNIKVRYVLVYRMGKIVDEIWQIDPKLHVH